MATSWRLSRITEWIPGQPGLSSQAPSLKMSNNKRIKVQWNLNKFTNNESLLLPCLHGKEQCILMDVTCCNTLSLSRKRSINLESSLSPRSWKVSNTSWFHLAPVWQCWKGGRMCKKWRQAEVRSLEHRLWKAEFPWDPASRVLQNRVTLDSVSLLSCVVVDSPSYLHSRNDGIWHVLT